MDDMALLLLAAGASARMRGRDKLLETVGGQPLLRRQAQAALATGAQVYVTLPPGSEARRAALDGLPVEIVEVADAGTGMAASFRAGIAALPATCRAVLVVLADMPDLGEDDFRLFFKTFKGDPDTPILRGASAGGRPGHPVLFPRRCFDDLAALTGDQGAKPILAAHADEVRLIPLPGQRALTDLDTPEAWEHWRQAQQ
ncbi:MAG: nucleotidyltransferase family protein [Paracoccaceae bacterium]